MSHRRHRQRKNRRDLAEGTRIRSCRIARDGDHGPGRLLPCLAGRPSDRPVDGAALAAELARIAELSRRGFST